MASSDVKQAVLLASGGLDSTTLAYWLVSQGIEFSPVFVNYGQHFAETELAALMEVLPPSYPEKLNVLNLGDIYKGTASRLINEPDLWHEKVSSEDFYLPYRNLLLLTVGAAFAQARGYSYLYSAFINSNHAQELDCSTEFFDKLTPVLADYGSVKIEMPFREMSKYEVAKLGISLKAPIGYTFSCHASSKIPCGACSNCVDRLEALQRLSAES